MKTILRNLREVQNLQERKLVPSKSTLALLIIARISLKVVVFLLTASFFAPNFFEGTKAAEVKKAADATKALEVRNGTGLANAAEGAKAQIEGVIPRAHFWKGKGEMRLASIEIDACKREYYIYRPSGSYTYPLPTLLAFHGHGGTARGMDKFTGGITALADKEGFLLVFPDGIDRGWVDGRKANAMPVRDDVMFVNALIERLVSSNLADARRVYACGISNGGFFSQYLAMKIPDKLAGAASVGASLSMEQESHRSAKPIPMMYILGTRDPLVPWEGGKIGFKHMRSRGQCVPATKAISFWLENNGNSSQNQETEKIPDSNKADKCTAIRTVYSSGNPRSDVTVYQVDNGGHTWPGGWQYLPPFLVGCTNRDFNANEALWSFFKEHHN